MHDPHVRASRLRVCHSLPPKGASPPWGGPAAGEVYVPSARQMPERILPFEYGGQFHVIKVNSWGYVRFAGFQIYLSETMIDQYIEFRPSEADDVFIACYRNYKKSGVLRQGWLTGETKNQQAVKPAKVLPMSCHNCYPCGA